MSLPFMEADSWSKMKRGRNKSKSLLISMQQLLFRTYFTDTCVFSWFPTSLSTAVLNPNGIPFLVTRKMIQFVSLLGTICAIWSSTTWHHQENNQFSSQIINLIQTKTTLLDLSWPLHIGMIQQSRPWQRLHTWQSFCDVIPYMISRDQNDYVAQNVCKERNNGK